MNRRFSVCVHESCHWTMKQIFGLPANSISVWADPKTNDTLGRVMPGGGYLLAEHDAKGSFLRVMDFYRHIPDDASGFIGEYLYNGNKDFWKMNSPDLIRSSEDFDCLMQRKKEEGIQRSEFKFLLQETERYLSLPAIWEFVLFLSKQLYDDLIEDGKASRYDANCVDLAKRKSPIKPQYNAYDFIEFLLKELYG